MGKKPKKDFIGGVIDDTLGGVFGAFSKGWSAGKTKSTTNRTSSRYSPPVRARRNYEGDKDSPRSYSYSDSSRSYSPPSPKARQSFSAGPLLLFSGLLLFGGYVAFHVFDHSGVTSEPVSPFSGARSPQLAGTVPSVQVNTPPPVQYNPEVVRVDETTYHVKLPVTGDWFDTGIPAVVDQEVDIYQMNEQWRTTPREDNARFMAKLDEHEEGAFSHGCGFTDWCVDLLPFTPQTRYDFVDTIKIKLLTTTQPFILLLITVRDTNMVSGQCFWRMIHSCPGYDEARQTALQKALELRRNVPIEGEAHPSNVQAGPPDASVTVPPATNTPFYLDESGRLFPLDTCPSNEIAHDQIRTITFDGERANSRLVHSERKPVFYVRYTERPDFQKNIELSVGLTPLRQVSGRRETETDTSNRITGQTSLLAKEIMPLVWRYEVRENLPPGQYWLLLFALPPPQFCFEVTP